MITTKDKKIISCKAMITEILDDGEKLRSLRQLMDRYQLSFPFTAYKVRGTDSDQVFTIINSVPTPYKFTCECCGVSKRFIPALPQSNDVFLSSSPKLCTSCSLGCHTGAWCPDSENWKLA